MAHPVGEVVPFRQQESRVEQAGRSLPGSFQARPRAQVEKGRSVSCCKGDVRVCSGAGGKAQCVGIEPRHPVKVPHLQGHTCDMGRRSKRFEFGCDTVCHGSPPRRQDATSGLGLVP